MTVSHSLSSLLSSKNQITHLIGKPRGKPSDLQPSCTTAFELCLLSVIMQIRQLSYLPITKCLLELCHHISFLSFFLCLAATVPVLVTVRPVNEFDPKCSKQVFSVPENTKYGYSIGNVNGSDQDYPFNNIEYSLMDADAGVFYISSLTGS